MDMINIYYFISATVVSLLGFSVLGLVMIIIIKILNINYKDMEELKYIPGDLVMTDGAPIGTKKGVAYVVTASDPNRTFTLKDGTVLKGSVTLDAVTEEDKAYFVETSTWVKHIVPIPLTFTILEANGFKKCKFYDAYSVANNPTLTIFLEKEKNSKNLIITLGGATLMYCNFVHQLQHFLFGLGLNSELKV